MPACTLGALGATAAEGGADAAALGAAAGTAASVLPAVTVGATSLAGAGLGAGALAAGAAGVGAAGALAAGAGGGGGGGAAPAGGGITGTQILQGAQVGLGAASLLSSLTAGKNASNIASGLQYTPIDIGSVTAAAQQQAAANAANSLSLQQQLQPNVAGANATLQAQINQQLKEGGMLPADIADQVATAARVSGGVSGAGGAAGPYTAALIGQTALGLQQQRQNNAAALVAANPPPVSGLDPGSLASLMVSQNSAQNQFNLQKAGIQTNVLNSQAQLAASGYGAASSLLGSAANLGKSITSTPTAPTITPPTATNPYATGPSYASSLPLTQLLYNPSQVPGGTG